MIVTPLRCGTGLTLISALLLSACADLPDLTGYSAATTQVRQSVAVAGNAVGAEIRNAGAAMSGDPQTTVEGAADKFDASWKKTVAGMDAMVDYAASIEAIAQAGNSGEESAEAVAAQVSGLAEALGDIFAPAGAIGALVDKARDAIGFVGGQIARIEGAKSLERAIELSGPSIIRLQELVQAQTNDARTLFESALRAQEDALLTNHSEALGVRTAVRISEKRSLGQLAALAATQPRNDATIATVKADLGRSRELLAAAQPELTEYDAALARIAARRTAGMALLDACDTALAAWGTAHVKLVEAIRNHRPATLASLNAAVTDLRELVKQWRETKP